jgi:hypothetical protein
MKVRNLNGAAYRTCGSESWLAHWENLSGLRAFMCFAEGCFGRPSVGGQVQKDRRTDGNWYVVPLCSSCNTRKGQDLDVWDYATLVCSMEGPIFGKGRHGSATSGAHRHSRRISDARCATARIEPAVRA